MNKEEKHLLNIKFMYEYYKDNIIDRYVRNLSDNIILDNDCLDIEGLEKIYVIPFKKHKQLEQENNQLKERINKAIIEIKNRSSKEVADLYIEILKGGSNE